jgi:hypothetical protein
VILLKGFSMGTHKEPGRHYFAWEIREHEALLKKYHAERRRAATLQYQLDFALGSIKELAMRVNDACPFAASELLDIIGDTLIQMGQGPPDDQED